MGSEFKQVRKKREGERKKEKLSVCLCVYERESDTKQKVKFVLLGPYFSVVTYQIKNSNCWNSAALMYMLNADIAEISLARVTQT